MEYVILIVAVVIFIILLDFKILTKRNLKNIRMDIFRIQKEISLLKDSTEQQLIQQAEAVKGEQPEGVSEEVDREEQEEILQGMISDIPKEVVSQELESELETVEVAASYAADINEQKQVFYPPPPPVIKQAEPKQKKKTFAERHPDLEKFIGENLINKIGIIILVLGLGFLVKYAIDKNWINEIGRVVIGIFSASILIGLAYKLRKNYKAFSSVLIGGGLALLYFTISLAFHTEGYPLYQQQTMAFVLLALITIFAVFLSVTYNRVEIAVFAMLGGFGSPLMVSNGGGNYVILFSYLMVLNIGMLVLSYFKKWRLINVLTFIFTVILFSSWFFQEQASESQAAFNGAIYFAASFYVLFFLMNIIYNIKHKLEFKAGDIILIISNTFVHFGLIMGMLSYIGDGIYRGIFTIILALFNFAFAFYIHKRQPESKNLLFLLIGLVLTFVTLAIPIQLEGNYITLFWAVEIVLLLWLSQKSGFKVLKLGSAVVMLLMLISIIMDWVGSYKIMSYSDAEYIKEYNFIFNKMFITALVSAGALFVTSFLLRKEKEHILWFMPVKEYRLVVTFLTIVVLYVGGLLEVNYQAYHYFVAKSSQHLVTVAYNSIFVLSLLIFAIKQNSRAITYSVGMILPAFIILFLLFASSIYPDALFSIVNGDEPYASTLLIIRWVSVLSVYAMCIFMFKLINNIYNYSKVDFKTSGIIFAVFAVVYLLSTDLDTIAILVTKNMDIVSQTHKTGYAVVWGLCSFIFMIIGMKWKSKILRILSLILFGVTMLKLFIYDISDISEGGKIVAFILLGVLLLIISFMYQRLKRLVIDADVSKKKKEDNEAITEE